VDAVGPHVDVVDTGQIPLRELFLLGLPLLRQPCDRGCREPRGGAEELLQRWDEVATRQAVQIQQRQHVADLRRPATPWRQDRRGKPLPFTRRLVDALVVHPGRDHVDRAGAGHHRPRLSATVAHHQAATSVITLVRELRDVAVHFGDQSSGEHPPGTLPHDLIDQRLRRRTLSRNIVLADYLEHRRAFPASVPAPACLSDLLDHREGTPHPAPIHRFQALLPPAPNAAETRLTLPNTTRPNRLNNTPCCDHRQNPPIRLRSRARQVQAAAITSISTSHSLTSVWTTMAVVGTIRPPSAAMRASAFTPA
jgi:hypothetical protein